VLFDLRYDNTLGGYGMNLYASAHTSGHNYSSSLGGLGVADFEGTFRLTGVTLTDGNAVSGGVTFDSGFTLGPIEAKSVGTITTENDPLKIGHIDESPKDASYESPVKKF
jgi:hypothetical protein